MGDPSGAGPAAVYKAVKKLRGLAEFVVIGDRVVFNKASGKKPSARPPFGRMRRGMSSVGGSAFGGKFVDLANVPLEGFESGKVKAEYGRASIEYLDRALVLINSRQIDCLVTAPICKESLKLAGFTCAGHTEYLAEHTGTKDFVMMLLNKDLKFTLVTRHIPLREVPLQLSKSEIVKTALLSNEYLKKFFRIRRPRIAACGLNPHASDNSTIGNEEARMISPAVEELGRAHKINIIGPLPADTAVRRAKERDFDCVLAMYHDQALIPLKLSGAETGVNLTLGLPFVRTAPLHGTAFDIAANPKLVNPKPLIAAIKLAVQCRSNLERS